MIWAILDKYGNVELVCKYHDIANRVCKKLNEPHSPFQEYSIDVLEETGISVREAFEITN